MTAPINSYTSPAVWYSNEADESSSDEESNQNDPPYIPFVPPYITKIIEQQRCNHTDTPVTETEQCKRKSSRESRQERVSIERIDSGIFEPEDDSK